MCGIFCQICAYTKNETIDPKIQHYIENRGPEGTNRVLIQDNTLNITFTASVLWMQGYKPIFQPIQNNKGLLLYNGDIFDREWDNDKSDTDQIMDIFTNSKFDEDIIGKIKMLKGPFSLIYYHKITNNLIFTRDRIGRNSLLLYNNDETIIISSVLGRKYDCIEIPASHIYILNLNNYRISLFNWDHTDRMKHEYSVKDWFKSVKMVQNLPDVEYSLENPVLDNFCEDPIIKYIETVALETSDKFAVMEKLLENFTIMETVRKLVELLNLSVEIRLRKQPNKCKSCILSTESCKHSSVGILFSGGLDCTILAYLTDKYVPKEQSIDLLNVAFKKDDITSYDVPDRLTGKQSLDELKKLCPNRKWIFKEVNIPKEVLIQLQEKTIADLVYPRQTILDESLGSALWFAALGDDNREKSPCRVLILGSGADELFGGYTRHRNAFKRQGWAGLAKELLFDWKRISFRNLARDNRVICHHGRQPRMPYLDEDFTNYVLKLKPWLKCFPSDQLGIGIGDKLFLRLVAFHLGLRNVSTFPKRAIQFGSRIANKKQKGSDISMNFMNRVKT